MLLYCASINGFRIKQGFYPYAHSIVFCKIQCYESLAWLFSRTIRVAPWFIPEFGGIHTFPAISSCDVVARLFTYFLSVSSSFCDAHGNAALNMPVALIKPSLLRRYDKKLTELATAHVRIVHQMKRAEGKRSKHTIRKYDSGYVELFCSVKMPEPFRSLGRGTRRWA